jgi:hypothetical protein
MLAGCGQDVIGTTNPGISGIASRYGRPLFCGRPEGASETGSRDCLNWPGSPRRWLRSPARGASFLRDTSSCGVSPSCRAVELQDVDGQAAQVAERAVANPEVVDDRATGWIVPAQERLHSGRLAGGEVDEGLVVEGAPQPTTPPRRSDAISASSRPMPASTSSVCSPSRGGARRSGSRSPSIVIGSGGCGIPS